VTFAKCVCVVLLTTLIVMVVRPARAEALEPVLISIIISGAVVVVALVAILIIANVAEGRRRYSEAVPEQSTAFLVLDVTTPAGQSP
jgi:hypothetical protein